MVSLALALLVSQVELPPEARVTPSEPERPQVSVVTRALLSGGGGVLAGGASLGIAYLLAGQNAGFDITFAAAGLSAIMISGVAYTIHEVLGGRGEITLGFLFSALAMAGATAIAYAVNPQRDIAPILAVGIGTVPAAVVAVLGLEGTSPTPKKTPAPVQVAVGPTFISGRF